MRLRGNPPQRTLSNPGTPVWHSSDFLSFLVIVSEYTLCPVFITPTESCTQV
jgi:hypothetical protein